jgi:hypothetical protein
MGIGEKVPRVRIEVLDILPKAIRFTGARPAKLVVES